MSKKQSKGAVVFEFQWPWLFVLLILPLLIRKWLSHIDPVDPTDIEVSQSLKVPFLEELVLDDQALEGQGNSTIIRQQDSLLARILLVFAWVMLVIAVAKPVWIADAANIPISSRNVIVAVDLSGSMGQRDFKLHGSKITRLAATKKVAIEFIKNRVGDRIGLILFADHAYLQAPLTRDLQTVMTLLDEAELGLAGERTALGNAIGLAVKKVQEKPDQEHVLVLMTDGAATTGISVDEAIRFAVKVGLKIYTVGIGSTLSSTQTQKTKAIGRNRTIGNGDLDVITLKNIADKTGGFYFRAKNIEELESIYEKLDELEPVVDISKAWHPVKDIFYIPLAFSSLLLFMLSLFRVGTNQRLYQQYKLRQGKPGV